MIEMLVVLFIGVILVGLLLPAMSRPTICSQRINCVNNLKQVGLAFRIWAGDNSEQLPTQVTVSNGGTAEVSSEVWRTFQLMSNELGAAKIILCPSDERQPPGFWETLANTNISYFIGLDAAERYPQMLLAGDRNITNGQPMVSNILTLSTNRPTGWTHAIHGNAGNVALADGSVQQVTSKLLQEQLRKATNAIQRLAMPE